ncbi:hypothetical protein SKAU_G00145570 [Synaphobranchus kaupii]|uniref:Uncharacterized protein n=1 Tax=Synaphobranchus kaupii TaxID=118154 RepID=A0A9Q1FT02_SYNKA|nr:hypothetical protein SKAU_G00145570 [Synaphobranchus kaupii]
MRYFPGREGLTKVLRIQDAKILRKGARLSKSPPSQQTDTCVYSAACSPDMKQWKPWGLAWNANTDQKPFADSSFSKKERDRA